MSQQNQKKTLKNQMKIHRRKNEQIHKQFDCSAEDCEKAYGSYAALYTHMKNKHPNLKPPNMPNQSKPKQSTGQLGRPKIKKTQIKIQESQSVSNNKYTCKLCLKQQCDCVQNFDNEDKNRIIEIMGEDKFINFTNQIGQLGDDTFSWVRRTQDDYQFKSPQTINMEIQEFNQIYEVNCQLSPVLSRYLSFSSKFWDKVTISQLYSTIYAVMAFQNYQVTLEFIKNNKYPRMESCIQANPTQFKRFQTTIRLI